MRLSEAEKGKNYRIKTIELTDDTKHRLFALGLTEDTIIYVKDKNNGPMIIVARGTRLAIGEKFCRGIIVGEMKL